MRHQVGIKYRPIVKEDKTKVEGGAKHKLRCFQQSTLIWEANFNETTSRLEDKAFEFRKKTCSGVNEELWGNIQVHCNKLQTQRSLNGHGHQEYLKAYNQCNRNNRRNNQQVRYLYFRELIQRSK